MSKFKLLKAAISVTDSAVNRIKYLLHNNNDPDIIGIHLSTKLRGCNGNSYIMNYVKTKNPTDERVSYKGINIYIDNKALFNIIGTQMDFIDNDTSSEFVFINPNSKGSCGCGESFNI